MGMFKNMRDLQNFARAVASRNPVIAWRHICDADTYVALLDTYSDHRTLPARRRQRLFDAIRRLAVDEFGGQVPRYYRTVIYLARSR